MRYFLLLVLLGVVGCSTTYGPYGYWRGGGYRDRDLGDGIHMVISEVYYEPDLAYEFFHRRAKELCGRYEVLEQSTGSATDAFVPVGGMILPVTDYVVQGRVRCY